MIWNNLSLREFWCCFSLSDHCFYKSGMACWYNLILLSPFIERWLSIGISKSYFKFWTWMKGEAYGATSFLLPIRRNHTGFWMYELNLEWTSRINFYFFWFIYNSLGKVLFISIMKQISTILSKHKNTDFISEIPRSSVR